MTGATHRLGGIAAGMIGAQVMFPQGAKTEIIIATITGAVLGSLIPDIDNSRSSISRKVPVISIVISLFQSLIRGASAMMPSKERKTVRGMVAHRGITHSLLMVVLTTIFLMTIGRLGLANQISVYPYFSLGIILGVLSHLILDMLAGGVPLFCPITNTRIAIARIKTGGLGEWIFRAAALLLLVRMIYNNFT